MGRDATKARNNPWYQARMKAAEYNGKLLSREGAAEMLGMSVSSVADAELGLTKCMPVDKAVLMADVYHAPELLNYYCIHECPIGCRHFISDTICDIDRITVKLLGNLNDSAIEEVKNKLLVVMLVVEFVILFPCINLFSATVADKSCRRIRSVWTPACARSP